MLDLTWSSITNYLVRCPLWDFLKKSAGMISSLIEWYFLCHKCQQWLSLYHQLVKPIKAYQKKKNVTNLLSDFCKAPMSWAKRHSLSPTRWWSHGLTVKPQRPHLVPVQEEYFIQTIAEMNGIPVYYSIWEWVKTWAPSWTAKPLLNRVSLSKQTILVW